MAFSPNGRVLASGSLDDVIQLWDAATGKQLGSPLTRHSGGTVTLAFSPDGRFLAAGSNDGSVRLWNVTSPAHATLWGLPVTANFNGVANVAFSPDSRFVAAVGGDDAVRILDLNVNYAIQRICVTTGNALNSQLWTQYVPGLPFQPPCP